jgi:hypothetical protein
MTNNPPWIGPITDTTEGWSAKYLSGIATKKRRSVEQPSMAPIKRSRWRTLRFKTGKSYMKAQRNPNPELFLLYFSLTSVRA